MSTEEQVSSLHDSFMKLLSRYFEVISKVHFLGGYFHGDIIFCDGWVLPDHTPASRRIR